MNSPTVSDQKIEANRQNALKSTGPKSDAGKAKSCQNARKHGIFCKDMIVPGEDPVALAEFKREIVRSLNPRNYMELQLVEQIIADEWRIKRVRGAERAAFEEIATRPVAPGVTPPIRIGCTGEDFHRLMKEGEDLERLQKYEQKLRNSIFRSLKEFRELHSQEKEEPSELAAKVVEAPDDVIEKNEATEIASDGGKGGCETTTPAENRGAECFPDGKNIDRPSAGPSVAVERDKTGR